MGNGHAGSDGIAQVVQASDAGRRLQGTPQEQGQMWFSKQFPPHGTMESCPTFSRANLDHLIVRGGPKTDLRGGRVLVAVIVGSCPELDGLTDAARGEYGAVG